MVRPDPRLPALIVILALAASGCASWRVTQESPAELLAQKYHHDMRVTVPDDAPIVLKGVRVYGDTLYGLADHSPPGVRVSTVRRSAALVAEGDERLYYDVAILPQQIQKLEIRKTDTAKTTLLVVGIGAMVASMIAAAVGDWDSFGSPMSAHRWTSLEPGVDDSLSVRDTGWHGRGERSP